MLSGNPNLILSGEIYTTAEFARHAESTQEAGLKVPSMACWRNCRKSPILSFRMESILPIIWILNSGLAIDAESILPE